MMESNKQLLKEYANLAQIKKTELEHDIDALLTIYEREFGLIIKRINALRDSRMLESKEMLYSLIYVDIELEIKPEYFGD